MPRNNLFSRRHLDAVLLDLDGVVTATADIHAVSWKKMFDAFLANRAEQKPFDLEEDYRTHVDGKPRYDGVRSFLDARGITLPEGTPDDSGDKETVCGLGNRKNELFLQHLRKQGIAAFPDAVTFIEQLRAAGIKTALVTSSKNGKRILKAAGIQSLFDAVVDGNDAQQKHLDGKPAPDIFLLAAERLDVPPERAAVVEDALSGVEAGRRGGFARVVGVNRTRKRTRLKHHGADLVVSSLSRLDVGEDRAKKSGDLPWALAHMDDLHTTCANKDIICFLDYDGTLTPIVDRPEKALLGDTMRRTVRRLARQLTVVVLSGRDLADVRRKVDLPDLYYGGSHGFDIAGPGKIAQTHEMGTDHLPQLATAEEMLRRRLAAVNGTQIERKKFSVAVHYRRVAHADAAAVRTAVEEALTRTRGLRRTSGKDVYELQPDIPWHKGRALRFFLESVLETDAGRTLPIYIGDDTTDEDAFREIADTGIGILVDDTGRRETAAHYRLHDTDEVNAFLETLSEQLDHGPCNDDWALGYTDYREKDEKLRETLTTLGNGYFCTRGASSMAPADDVHYPGTYLAGGYNRLTTEVAGRCVENEDLVNLPDWLPLTFRIGDSPWCHQDQVEILHYTHTLDIKHGVLKRHMRFRDGDGRETTVCERRLVHMEHPHLAGLTLAVTAENWSGKITFRSAINGGTVNDGVARYRGLNNRHWTSLCTQREDADTIALAACTRQSHMEVALAARTREFHNHRRAHPQNVRIIEEPEMISRLSEHDLHQGRTLRVEKTVALYTTKDRAATNPMLEACQAAAGADDFSSLLATHQMAWRQLWQRFTLDIAHADNGTKPGRIGMIVHLYTFHLLQTTGINTMRMGLDVGVPSRGWHGEAYRGHIFWDELFIFPMLNLRLPEVTRSLLMYRYRRLSAARKAARELGLRGAMYPWQSGSNGREESQRVHLNPRSGRWVPDNSRLQRHVNIAIAYNLYHYFQVTKDMEFMAFYGAEMLVEIALFWSSSAVYNEDLERYEILGIMGPDEYHDAYPGSRSPGLNNNAYTNVMVVWVLTRTRRMLDTLPQDVRRQLMDKLNLGDDELARWKDICRKMRIVFHEDGIISQFEGYADLEEFDWEGYRRRYGDIQRLDRILEQEDDSPNRYKASKQADVLMLFYLLSAEELAEIFQDLGYSFRPEMIPENVDYYLHRTSHGSTLSNVVHAWVLLRGNREQSWRLFSKALQSDVNDIQGGTTPEGIHLGAMAGTVDQLQRGYTGIVARDDVLWFNPCLPEELTRLSMHLRYRCHYLEVILTPQKLHITSLRNTEAPIRIGFRDQVHELKPADTLVFPIGSTTRKKNTASVS